MKLYLAHGIFTRRDVRKLEKDIEKKLKIKLHNPFYDNPFEKKKRILQTLNSLIDENPDYHITVELKYSPRLSKRIVEEDMKYIKECDGLLAVIFEPSIGAAMEIFYAKHVLDKPVIVYTPWDHPWLYYFSDKVVKDKKALYKELRKLKKKVENNG